MPWCPKCKSEYVEGIKECKKCHCNLVEQLIKEDEIIAYGEMVHLQGLADMLKENGISSARIEYDAGQEKNALLVDSKERPNAAKCIEDMMRLRNEQRYRQMQRVRPGRNLGVNEVYQNKREKAEDVKSSAYALIIVGIGGIILDALCVFDIIQIRMSVFTKTITCSVMGFLFICLVVFGILSVKSFKSLLFFAKEEDKMTGEIEKWYKKELSAGQIDAMLADTMDPSLSEEEKYFPRMEQIRNLMAEKFMNLDPSYADNMAETIYQELFEDAD